MLEEPSAIRVVVVVKEDKELLQWLERVRKEGITVVVEREGVPRVAISRVVKGRPGVVFPQIVYESTATEEEVQRALSLAGAWEDFDFLVR